MKKLKRQGVDENIEKKLFNISKKTQNYIRKTFFNKKVFFYVCACGLKIGLIRCKVCLGEPKFEL